MSDESACIFCRIVAGQIPCHAVYSDDSVLAFLDIGPLAPGHLLVIPKSHHQTLDELSPNDAAALGRALPKLVGVVKRAAGAAGVNVLQNNGRAAGQEVSHVHVHLIPRQEGDGLGYRWSPGKYGHGEAEAMRDKMAMLASE